MCLRVGTSRFKLRLRIVINSKNEAARFKRVAARPQKYHESMTRGDYMGTVVFEGTELYSDQIKKSSSALKR